MGAFELRIVSIRARSIDLPQVRSAKDAVEASSLVLSAVAEGMVTPDEAGRLMALLSAHINILEAGDHEQRIAELETLLREQVSEART